MSDRVRNRLKKLGITATRSLGQNFLDDDAIAERIVKSADISENETVLEIGPGLGILTDELLKYAGKLILVEKDSALIGYLKGRYQDKNVKIIEGDVLDIELPNFDKVVSNLPFSISSPITFKLLEGDIDFNSCVLTYQKEYADRMRAGPGEKNYSRLSVMVSTLADVERLFDIPKNKFYPPPKVDATVLRLALKEPGFELRYPKVFSKVVRELFNYRRKMIGNSLNTGLGVPKRDEIPYKNKRVEKLSPEEINQIVNFLVEKDLID